MSRLRRLAWYLSSAARLAAGRPRRLSCVTDGTTVWECCRARGPLCASCGYAGTVELSLLEALGFSAGWNALRSMR